VSQIEEVFGVDASAPAGGMMVANVETAGEEAVESKRSIRSSRCKSNN